MTAAIQASNGYCMKPQTINLDHHEELCGTWYMQRRAPTLLSSPISFACKSLDITMGHHQNNINIKETNEDFRTHKVQTIFESIELEEGKGQGKVIVSRFLPDGDIRFVHLDADSMIMYSCRETKIVLGSQIKSEGAYILTKERFPSEDTMNNLRRIFDEKMPHAYEAMKMRKVSHDSCVTEDEAETD